MIGTDRIEVRRLVAAPVAEVFRWWSEPALLERWMSPIGTVEAEVDLRVGGNLRIVMKGEAVEIEHRGHFVEIDPPRRLAFTWESIYTNGPSLVTVSFERDGDAATNVVIVHSRLSPGAAASHAGGWAAMLDRLGRELVTE
ncbi:MAG TPA: SRPBCC domain-containing protein [Candidatus Dormibacteraeota bacterium]|nr:SRPBCC domain-containing protein [Candidatus Dormibacteraeota bacterium]